MSISKDLKTKTWTVQVWYKDFTGKRKHTTKKGFTTKKEAEKWERSFKSQEHPEILTMETLIDSYREHLEVLVKLGNIRETTYTRKVNYIKLYISPYFNSIQADKVKTDNINKWLSTVVLHTDKYERLSSSTVNSAKGILSQIFDYGKKKYGLTNNPTKDAESLKLYSNNRRAEMWTAEQFTLLYNSLQQEDLKMLFLTIYLAGLRIGEALALTAADITEEGIVVNKAIPYIKGTKDKVTQPKTRTSNRTVKIPENLYKLLLEYINNIMYLKPTDRIFQIERTRATSAFRNHMIKLGLPKASIHTLRHSYASLLYNACKDISVVTSQLGHSSSKVTLGIYTHMVAEEDKKAVQKLNFVLELNSNGTPQDK